MARRRSLRIARPVANGPGQLLAPVRDVLLESSPESLLSPSPEEASLSPREAVLFLGLRLDVPRPPWSAASVLAPAPSAKCDARLRATSANIWRMLVLPVSASGDAEEPAEYLLCLGILKN